MCGVAAYLNFCGGDLPSDCVQNLASGVRHRGPDGVYDWVSEDQRFVMVHALLKIMDKSDDAIQPIRDAQGNTLIFNGSIYNYPALKSKYNLSEELNDTQTLMELIKSYGEQILPELEGMFAIIYYDAGRGDYLIARDRFGEKPLFYSATSEGNLVLASERKSLWNVGIPKSVNPQVALDFLLYHKLGGLSALYEGIYEIPAGHYARISDAQLTPQKINFSEQPVSDLDGSMRESLEQTHVADFTIAHTLSGGIDSGGVLSYSQELGRPEIFSFRSPGSVEDESERTQSVADYLGLADIRWVEFPPDSEAIIADWQRLSAIHEEPLASPSSMAQYYVYRAISEAGHRIVLEGQGSDELFCGYTYYLQGLLSDHLPSLSYMLTQSTADEKRTWRKWLLARYIPRLYQRFYRRKGQKLAQQLRIKSEVWNTYRDSVLDSRMEAALGGVKAQMLTDRTQGLFQYILRTADRSSMYQHVEVRLPYLYSGLVSLAGSLGLEDFWDAGYFKKYLRDQWADRLPVDVIRRKEKNGFEAPYDRLVSSVRFKEMLQEAYQYLYGLGWLDTDIPPSDRDMDTGLHQLLMWKVVSLYLAITD